MQLTDVIKTIKWINDAMPDSLKSNFVTLKIIRESSPGEIIKQLAMLIHQLGFFQQAVSQNAKALCVLQSFNLKALTTGELFIALTEAIQAPHKDRPGIQDLHSIMWPISQKWIIMNECAKSISDLVLPAELTQETIPSDIITVEIRASKDQPDLSVLTKTTNHLNNIYGAMQRIYGGSSTSQLKIVKVESGSLITIDCKGIAETVQHTKNFLLEAWHKIRHKRAEEVIQKNHAVLSSLAVANDIDALLKNKKISREEAEKLRRTVINGALGLFENAALLSEIPEQEIINNDKLVETFTPKLLCHDSAPTVTPPPEDQKSGDQISTKSERRKKK